MNAEIFRKVSLARLSSPEQLDTMLHVSNPKSWLALIALLGILAAATFWGFGGTVTTKVAGQGVVIRGGGVMDVASLGSGRLVELRVNVGTKVKAAQVIAIVAQPALLEKIRGMEAEIADNEAARSHMLEVRNSSARLRLDALERERASFEQQLKELESQRQLTSEQVPVDEELLAKGLITRQQTYQTRQRLMSIASQLAGVRAQMTQLNSARYEAETQGVEAELESRNRLTDRRRGLESLRKELGYSLQVVTPYSGEVLEIKMPVGALVSSSTPIISVQPDVRELEAVVYVPAGDSKSVRAGMTVELSPTVVKREEFGFIRARVASVAGFPATEAALMRLFENAALLQSFMSKGPITEVRVRMLEDASTPSGYRWSSGKGAPVTISGGTLCTAQVVTREQPPASLVIPRIKELFGL
jgi:HlyD family secretion protein